MHQCTTPLFSNPHHQTKPQTIKVEAIESGVFRADLPVRFKCRASAYQGLLDALDRDLKYAIKHDAKWAVEDVANYGEVRAAIAAKLEALRDAPNRCALWGGGGVCLYELGLDEGGCQGDGMVCAFFKQSNQPNITTHDQTSKPARRRP
jgi:hypothetical protein